MTMPGLPRIPAAEAIGLDENKESHQIFIEPEGINKDLVYPNGISTSLPKKTQQRNTLSLYVKQNRFRNRV